MHHRFQENVAVWGKRRFCQTRGKLELSHNRIHASIHLTPSPAASTKNSASNTPQTRKESGEQYSIIRDGRKKQTRSDQGTTSRLVMSSRSFTFFSRKQHATTTTKARNTSVDISHDEPRAQHTPRHHQFDQGLRHINRSPTKLCNDIISSIKGCYTSIDIRPNFAKE